MRTTTSRGFTLIELLIVVSIIAIIAAIAIPNLMSARSSANEKTVVATMRAIVTAQQVARTNGTIDQNRNGQGEAGSLPELAGLEVLRGGTTVLRPAALSAALGQLDANGYAFSHGFYFAMYLPDVSGQGVLATPANFASIHAPFAESFWTCVAWPRERATQGYGTFFTNQNGDILVSKGASYSGTASVPPAGAGLLVPSPDRIDASRSAAGASDGVGADGNVWRVVP
ncbi:MAG: type II secretion system protein [Planctomycetota bacterium]